MYVFMYVCMSVYACMYTHTHRHTFCLAYCWLKFPVGPSQNYARIHASASSTYLRVLPGVRGLGFRSYRIQGFVKVFCYI